LGPKRLIGFSPPKKRKEKRKKEKEGKRKKERKKESMGPLRHGHERSKKPKIETASVSVCLKV